MPANKMSKLQRSFDRWTCQLESRSTGRLGSTNFTRLSPLHYTGRVGDHGGRGQKFTFNLMRGAHITWP